MEFGMAKCAMLVMKSGKRHLTDGIELPNQDKIRTFREKETYKYLDILEADHKIKLKEREKKDRYLNLVSELKKNKEHEGDNYTNRDWCFWYSHVLKGLEDLEVRGRVETIQTTTLLRTARILRRFLET